MSKIARLRELSGLDIYVGYREDERVEEIEDILRELKAEVVDTSFEEGGRWSNYETTVCKVVELIDERSAEIAYFQVTQERPATEMQEGGEFSYQFDEVTPRQKVITVYE